MAHFTEASFWVENRILIEKNSFRSFSRPPRPTFQSIFDLKMAIFRIFLSQILTNVLINAIFGMYLCNSSSFKGELLILTSKVNEGHLRSSEVNKKVIIRGQKYEKNLFGNFYSALYFLSNGIQYMKLSSLKKNYNFFFSTRSSFFLSPIPHPWKP